jgi:hypothetical protein
MSSDYCSGEKEMSAYRSAIDLMLEDLQKHHGDIRKSAKHLGCEKELDEIKLDLIEYLYTKRPIQ